MAHYIPEHRVVEVQLQHESTRSSPDPDAAVSSTHCLKIRQGDLQAIQLVPVFFSMYITVGVWGLDKSSKYLISLLLTGYFFLLFSKPI